MGRRTVLLVAAVLVAAIGAGLVLIYVHDMNQKVKAREAPEQILVAKKVIPAGTTGAAASAEGDLEFMKVAREAVAPGRSRRSTRSPTWSPWHRSTQASRF